MNRHNLYYRLMDIALGAVSLMIAAAVFKQIMGYSAVGGVLRYPFAVVFVLGTVLPALLIFQRWMRDDFSEMLWQRAAGTVLKALIILPLPAMVIVATAFALGNPGPAIEVTDSSSAGFSTTHNATLTGAMRTLVTLWLFTPAIFTLSFQWHRWRASR
jgi:hypothetical protein